jgi:antitoxin component HigA of HigAB toxin-antitoxin module
MKKKVDDRKAAHAKQDPSAVKKNYGPGVIPPGTAYNKASKRGMNPSQAANAVSNAFKNRAKSNRKLPESVEIDESVAKAYEIMKPTKSMNHGIEAIKKTMKVDHGTATNLAKQVMDKVKKGEFKEGSDERLALIRKIGNKYNQQQKKAEKDAKRAIKKDKYLNRDMDEKTDHSAIIARAQKDLTAAEKRNDKEAADKHRETISRHQLQMTRERWEL